MDTLRKDGKVWLLNAGGYSAVIAPEIGGNLIALRKGDYDVLRHYKSYGEILKATEAYGLPILFPPNRIDGGQFQFEGRTYKFPINEKETNNSLHGFLSNRPWNMSVLKAAEDEIIIDLTFEGDKSMDYYAYYPHEFLAKITYTLNSSGLKQDISITNKGDGNMPFGLGWHSAFALEFKKGINPENVRVKVSLGQRVELNERSLPTGSLLPLSNDEEKFRTKGQSPLYKVMDDHFTVQPIDKDGEAFHGAIIEDSESGARLVYKVDSAYKHWMVWNCFKEGSFVCIEPQNWRVNAPNLDLSAEESGMGCIGPGETFVAGASIYVG